LLDPESAYSQVGAFDILPKGGVTEIKVDLNVKSTADEARQSSIYREALGGSA